MNNMSKVLSNLRITQHYGNNKHTGVDLGQTSDKKVFANADGTVEQIQTGYGNNKNSKGMATYGNMILIKHPNGMKTRYAHLQTVQVKIGQSVKAGQQIGIQGNTGNSYGTHLHYEVYRNGSRINPESYIQTAVYSVPNNAKKSNDVIAQEVINGKWGSGEDRKKRLTNAGYNYSTIQALVNQKLSGKKTTPSVSYYPRYTGNTGSIVEALNGLKINSSYSNRSSIAKKNGISGYKGTASQNIKLLDLLKKGKLIK